MSKAQGCLEREQQDTGGFSHLGGLFPMQAWVSGVHVRGVRTGYRHVHGHTHCMVRFACLGWVIVPILPGADGDPPLDGWEGPVLATEGPSILLHLPADLSCCLGALGSPGQCRSTCCGYP